MQQSRIDHEKAKIPKAYEELEELSTRTDGHTPLYRIWEGHDGMEQMFHEAIGQLL